MFITITIYRPLLGFLVKNLSVFKGDNNLENSNVSEGKWKSARLGKNSKEERLKWMGAG